MNMAGYERLMRDHAYWAGQVQHFKRATSALMFDGPRCPRDGETCIDHAFRECRDLNEDTAEGGGYTFAEIWADLLAEGKACDTCQEARRLKAERVAASRRLGAVRAAMTRVGRGLTMSEARDRS